MTELVAFVDKADALASKINPDSKTTANIFQDAIHGTGGGASLLLTYESAAAWAAERAALDASEEWGQLMQQFPGASFPVRYQGMSNVVYRSEDYSAPAAGEAMQVFGFAVNGGGLGPLVEFVKGAEKLRKQMGIPASVEIVNPIAAGTNTGGVIILVRYPSAVTWAEAGVKQNANADWQTHFSNFPVDQFTLNYDGMSFVAR